MRAPRGTHLAFHSHLSTPLLCWASPIQSSVPPSQAGEESLFPWFSGSWPTLVICSQFPNTLSVRRSTLAGSQGHGQKTLLSSHDTWGIVGGASWGACDADWASGSPFWSAGPSRMLSFSMEFPGSPASLREWGTYRLSSAGPPLQAVGAGPIPRDPTNSFFPSKASSSPPSPSGNL